MNLVDFDMLYGHRRNIDGYAAALTEFDGWLAELLPQRRQKCTAQTVVPWLLLFGIFGIALLRCAMIAFVEVSSFGIGTSTMYLATVHPLLVLYAFAGLLLYGRPRKTDKRRENA